MGNKNDHKITKFSKASQHNNLETFINDKKYLKKDLYL